MLDAILSLAAGKSIQPSADPSAVDLSKQLWTAGASDRPANGFVEAAIHRLEELIEEETAALRNRANIDLKDFNNRKSHGLLELSRALRHCEGGAIDEVTRARLGQLRGKLETNRAVIKMHLDAVREISAIVTAAIQAAESDGTYSQARTSQKRP